MWGLADRYNFQPIPIGVADEIDAHFGILIADTSHFFMGLVGAVEIIGGESQMDFVVPRS